MRLFEASVQQAFTAAHGLPSATGVPEESHKHTWVITATFRAAELDEPMGVVIDFVRVQSALAEIAGDFESCDLNARPEFTDVAPSAERVAHVLAARLTDALGGLLTAPDDGGPYLYRLEVTEAPGCAAAFLPHGEA